jgi:hypothetical protein
MKILKKKSTHFENIKKNYREIKWEGEGACML